MSLDPGRVLGPYEIIEQAGAGGMGEVYKAKDNRLDRIVAIKVLPASFDLNVDIKQRFEREAKTISSLNHPNICTLYDVGYEDGLQYLVMEFIEGETLSERIKKGPIPMKEFLEISTQVADALDKAHRQGLVHRDLKPGNIMLTRTGAKLLDFGLAKIQLESSTPGVQSITQTTPLTGVGTLLGTMQYMAPEQLEGSEADTRSDIFAFGAVMYEMATGTRAFSGGSQASLIASILKEEPRSVSEISPQLPPILEQTISQCLAKDPEQRWQSVADLKRSLQWIADGKVGAATSSLIPRNRSTRETIIMIGMICFFSVAAVLGYLYFAASPPEGQTVRAMIQPPENAEVQSFGGGHVAISPDGSRLVFMAEDTASGNNLLWIRPFNSLAAVPLQGTEDAEYPFWSPDNKYIGFFADSKLKKIPAIGGPVLTLCETENNPRGGTWNTNNVILFTPSINDPIYKVSAAGGESTPVTEMDTTMNENSQRFPSFLPDGDHFLFFSRVEGGNGGEKDAVCVGSLSDPSVTRLFLAKSNAMYAHGYIYFMREAFLMVQPFDIEALEITGDPFPVAEEVLFASRYNKGSFTVSENSNLVYEKGVATDGTVLSIRNRNSADIDTILNGDAYYSGELSPDEQRMVMTSAGVSDRSDIWIYDFNQAIGTRFTFDDAGEAFAIFSPDGSLVAYSSSSGDTVGGDFTRLLLKESSGSRPESLLVDIGQGSVFACQFTADGKKLMFQRFTDGPPSLWLLDLETGAVESIFDTTTAVVWGRISPNNRWLAYGAVRDDVTEVYVTTFPKPSGKWQASAGPGGLPRWNGDGSELFYANYDDEICAVEISETARSLRIGKADTLFSVNPVNLSLIYTPFSDGQRFLTFENFATTSDNQIIFVQNYKQEFLERK